MDTTELQYIAPGSHRHGIYATNDNDTPTLIAERFATSHDLTVKIFLSLNQHFLPDLRSMSKFRPLTRVFLTAAAAASAVSTGADAMAAYVTATDVYADPVMLLREPPLVTSEAFFTPLDTLFRECEVLKLHHLNIRNQSTPAPPAGATVDTWSLSASKHQSTAQEAGDEKVAMVHAKSRPGSNPKFCVDQSLALWAARRFPLQVGTRADVSAVPACLLTHAPFATDLITVLGSYRRNVQLLMSPGFAVRAGCDHRHRGWRSTLSPAALRRFEVVPTLCCIRDER